MRQMTRSQIRQLSTETKVGSAFRNLMRKLGDKPKQVDSTEAAPFSAFTADNGHPLLDNVAVEQWLMAEYNPEEPEMDEEPETDSGNVSVPSSDAYADFADADHLPDYDLHASDEDDEEEVTERTEEVQSEEFSAADRARIALEVETMIAGSEDPLPEVKMLSGHIAASRLHERTYRRWRQSRLTINTRAENLRNLIRQNRGLKQRLNAAEALNIHLEELSELNRKDHDLAALILSASIAPVDFEDLTEEEIFRGCDCPACIGADERADDYYATEDELDSFDRLAAEKEASMPAGF